MQQVKGNWAWLLVQIALSCNLAADSAVRPVASTLVKSQT